MFNAEETAKELYESHKTWFQIISGGKDLTSWDSLDKVDQLALVRAVEEKFGGSHEMETELQEAKSNIEDCEREINRLKEDLDGLKDLSFDFCHDCSEVLKGEKFREEDFLAIRDLIDDFKFNLRGY